MEIVEQNRPEAAERDLIGRHLRRSNRQLMPRVAEIFRHAFYLRDETGDVVGGLWAEKGLDWVFVDLLFVPDTLRGQGIGADLLRRVEARARDWGAIGIWLATYGFQARSFYEKQGYTCFAELEGQTPEASDNFMRKYLG